MIRVTFKLLFALNYFLIAYFFPESNVGGKGSNDVKGTTLKQQHFEQL